SPGSLSPRQQKGSEKYLKPCPKTFSAYAHRLVTHYSPGALSPRKDTGRETAKTDMLAVIYTLGCRDIYLHEQYCMEQFIASQNSSGLCHRNQCRHVLKICDNRHAAIKR